MMKPWRHWKVHSNFYKVMFHKILLILTFTCSKVIPFASLPNGNALERTQEACLDAEKARPDGPLIKYVPVIILGF